jgi:hypothetical protein
MYNDTDRLLEREILMYCVIVLSGVLGVIWFSNITFYISRQFTVRAEFVVMCKLTER